jgi:hypothetical protein
VTSNGEAADQELVLKKWPWYFIASSKMLDFQGIAWWLVVLISLAKMEFQGMNRSPLHRPETI